MSSMVSLITMFRYLELIVWEWLQWRCVVVFIWSFHIDSDSTIRGKETLVAGNWILVWRRALQRKGDALDRYHAFLFLHLIFRAFLNCRVLSRSYLECI